MCGMKNWLLALAFVLGLQNFYFTSHAISGEADVKEQKAPAASEEKKAPAEGEEEEAIEEEEETHNIEEEIPLIFQFSIFYSN